MGTEGMQDLGPLNINPQSQPATRPLVLLVLDDEDTRAELTFALSAAGFDVVAASDPASPHWSVVDARPDLIVLDVSAERADGWLRVSRFRRDPEMHGAPLVAVVAELSAGIRARAQQEGCAALSLTTCPPDVFASGLHAVLRQIARAS